MYYTGLRYGSGSAQIDGVVVLPEGEIAIEVESRVAKQARGAILDLFFHRARKKLFVIVPKHMNNPQALKEDAEYILNKLRKLRPDIVFKVVVLKGSGDNPKPNEDLKILEKAVAELREVSIG